MEVWAKLFFDSASLLCCSGCKSTQKKYICLVCKAVNYKMQWNPTLILIWTKPNLTWSVVGSRLKIGLDVLQTCLLTNISIISMILWLRAKSENHLAPLPLLHLSFLQLELIFSHCLKLRYFLLLCEQQALWSVTLRGQTHWTLSLSLHTDIEILSELVVKAALHLS